METIAHVEEAKQEQKKPIDSRTPAQKAFDRVQSKRVSDCITLPFCEKCKNSMNANYW